MDDMSLLSADHCVLLAVHYASESNIAALHNFTPAQSDVFSPELVLRILLTYLPESTEPSLYTTYIHEVASRLYLEQRESAAVDTSPVKELSNSQARKQVQKLQLLPLQHSELDLSDDNLDVLTHFLIHRAHRIDAQTGLLNLVPLLVVPFLDQSHYLRTWLISSVLPLLRFGYEYYPQDNAAPPLASFINYSVPKGVDLLLSRAHTAGPEGSSIESTVGRDIKGLVGPWMYGDELRKKRKLKRGQRRASVAEAAEDIRRMSLDGAAKEVETDHDWEHVFMWLVRTAAKNFLLVTEAIEEWDGPGDVDFGGYGDARHYLDEEVQQKLELQYAQAAFASIYAVEADTPETIEGAHSLLVRLAHLMDFEPPPDLATSVELLPKIDSHSAVLHETSTSALNPEVLSKPGHPLTTPKLATFSLLQMFVYSAYLLAGVGHSISIVNAAKLRFYGDEDEQLSTLQKVLHGLTTGQKKDEQQWTLIRNRLLWLWHWGMDADEEGAQLGAGIFGKVERSAFEKEILKAFLSSSCYSLIIKTYIENLEPQHRLYPEDVEKVILASAMHHYDNASNGNRTRGGMKKASDMINTFRPYFPTSSAFRRCEALLSATHALSFYSLTLQHGVPFQPVNIRVSKDPISLVGKVLDQNLRSYTKLDDLINIGKNLVAAGLPEGPAHDVPAIEPSTDDLEQQKRTAERRIIGMAIEAALAENDFETAYSYVINRLTPPTTTTPPRTPSSGPPSRSPSIPPTFLPPTRSSSARQQQAADDDISWRAAFLAGKYRGHDNSSSPPTAPLRRLEQRMELLSHALLLAPPAALPEILAAWRRCEEEMTALLAREAAEERRFDDHADRKLPGAFVGADDAAVAPVQPRREVGRGAVEEAPMGLFDVARGAAAAFSRSAFPLGRVGGEEGGAAGAARVHARNASAAGSETGSVGGSDGEGRVRKRDLVANAVTGGLASGLGWVLGATPVRDQERE